jgi:hypothetical protein
MLIFLKNLNLRNVFGILIFFTSLSSYFFFGISAADWGYNFSDEIKLYNTIKQSFLTDTGLLLPRWYSYPSLMYWISMFFAFGYLVVNYYDNIINLSLANAGDIKLFLEILDNLYEPIITYLRKVFIILSLFVPLLVFIGCRLLNIRFLYSILASAIILSSFQIFYHVRWVATDTLLLITGIATSVVFLWAKNKPTLFRICILTITSGLAVSSKYPGGLFLILPLILANKNIFSIKKTTLVLLIFCNTFYLITPGSLIEFWRFYTDVKFEISHYSDLGHWWHTIESGWPHFLQIINFLALRSLSHSSIITLIYFLFCCAGFYFCFKNSKINFFAFCIMPLFYIIYFSSMKVMIVRNLLLLIPFIVIMIAYCYEEISKIKNFKNVEIFLCVVTLLFVITSGYKFYISTNSLNSSDKTIKVELNQYIKNLSNKKIAYSAGVEKYLDIQGDNLKDVNQSELVDILLFFQGELRFDEKDYIVKPYLGNYANKINNYLIIAGPKEYDIDYYPYSPGGKKRILAIFKKEANLLMREKKKGIIAGIITK